MKAFPAARTVLDDATRFASGESGQFDLAVRDTLPSRVRKGILLRVDGAEETGAVSRWMMSACVLALLAVPAAAADVRLDSYRTPKSETFRNFNQLYLDGVKSGLMAYNARVRSRGGQPAFCMPA